MKYFYTKRVVAAFFVIVIFAGPVWGDTEVTRAVAVLHPTEGNRANGIVVFTPVDGGVQVMAELKGLSPGKHGFHIHTYGDCSAPDATSAGGHFNPAATRHAGPMDAERHVGDLGNILAGPDGKARLDWTDPVLRLEGENSVIGRAVVVHVGEDDLVSQPSGNAGPRAACGVIGIAK